MIDASPSISLGDSPSINLIVKLSGTRCNLQCDYCFEKRKSISSPQDGFVSIQQIEKFIQNSESPINLVFHGGEPLLAPPSFFREMLNSLRLQKNRIKSVQIQTNGTLLSQELIDVFWKEFSDYSIEIAISLDGNETMNALRVSQGKESFSQVMRAFQLLEKNGISAGVLSVIHRNSLPMYKAFIDFISSIPNVKFLKLNPLHLLSEDASLLPDSISPSEFAYFVINLFSCYVNSKLYERFPIEPCLSIIQRISGCDTHYCNYSNRKCTNFICLYPNGTMSLCDSLPYDGFSFTELQKKKSVAKSIVPLLDVCSTCNLFDFCKGGCLGIRFSMMISEQLQKDYCLSKRILHDFFLGFIREDK